MMTCTATIAHNVTRHAGEPSSPLSVAVPVIRSRTSLCGAASARQGTV